MNFIQVELRGNNKIEISGTSGEPLKQAKKDVKISYCSKWQKFVLTKALAFLYSLDELHNSWEHIDNKSRHL